MRVIKMNELRIIIAGTRSFNNAHLLIRILNKYLCGLVDDGIITSNEMIKFISGTARGADQLGEQFAKACKCEVVRFPADWNKYGKSAGIIRNHEMGNYADYLIAFWDGKSRGTKNVIEEMRRAGKHGKVILYEKN